MMEREEGPSKDERGIKERIAELRRASKEKYARTKCVMDQVERQFKSIFLHLSRLDQAHFYANKMIDLLESQAARQSEAMENQGKVKDRDTAEFIECSTNKRDAVFEKLFSRLSDHHGTLDHPIDGIENSVKNTVGELGETVKMFADEFLGGEQHKEYRDGVMREFRECGEVTESLVQMASMNGDIDVLASSLEENSNGARNLRSNRRPPSGFFDIGGTDDDEEDDTRDKGGGASSSSSQKKRRSNGTGGEVVALLEDSDSDFERGDTERRTSSKKKKGSMSIQPHPLENSPYVQAQASQRRVSTNEANAALDMIGKGEEVGQEVAAIDKSMGNYSDDSEEEAAVTKSKASTRGSGSGSNKRKRGKNALDSDQEWASGQSDTEEEAELDFEAEADQNRANGKGKGKSKGAAKSRSKLQGKRAAQAVTDLT